MTTATHRPRDSRTVRITWRAACATIALAALISGGGAAPAQARETPLPQLPRGGGELPPPQLQNPPPPAEDSADAPAGCGEGCSAATDEGQAPSATTATATPPPQGHPTKNASGPAPASSTAAKHEGRGGATAASVEQAHAGATAVELHSMPAERRAPARRGDAPAEGPVTRALWAACGLAAVAIAAGLLGLRRRARAQAGF